MRLCSLHSLLVYCISSTGESWEALSAVVGSWAFSVSPIPKQIQMQPQTQAQNQVVMPQALRPRKCHQLLLTSCFILHDAQRRLMASARPQSKHFQCLVQCLSTHRHLLSDKCAKHPTMLGNGEGLVIRRTTIPPRMGRQLCWCLIKLSDRNDGRNEGRASKNIEASVRACTRKTEDIKTNTRSLSTHTTIYNYNHVTGLSVSSLIPFMVAKTQSPATLIEFHPHNSSIRQ